MNVNLYKPFLTDIKNRIRNAQVRATLSANAEMIVLYWDIGRAISKMQKEQGWGATVTIRLANDIRCELPEIKGFSERNLKFMIQFYKGYCLNEVIRKQPVSQLPEKNNQLSGFIKHVASQIPWGHNILLMQKIKEKEIRLWYIGEILSNGWSREMLALMIKRDVHLRQGETTNNFSKTLSNNQSDLVKETLKDPYMFDFITLTQPFTERELETELVKHVQKFLLELGAGFAFVGRQYKLTVSDKDFYLDLLFYHLKMRCFIVIDLKKGDFRPEYAGKMNFYCSAVDDLIRYKGDRSTIGLILCQTKDKIMAEYSLRDINSPIGISEFQLTKLLPKNMKSSLPTIEEIENGLRF